MTAKELAIEILGVDAPAWKIAKATGKISATFSQWRQEREGWIDERIPKIVEALERWGDEHGHPELPMDIVNMAAGK